MLRKILIILSWFIIINIFQLSCKKQNKEKIRIFHAGSLSVPFKAMEREFEAKYPHIDILREPAGSIKCARKISDLKKPCDIMASADYRIIDNLLIPEYAEWNLRFANNQIVLCYTEKSKWAEQINSNNWYDILQKKDVVWGHADPNLDPCGYGSLLVMQLAEKYYKKQGLYGKMLANRPKGNIRPKSVELISLLQTGNMDYAWEYLSVAIQRDLKYIILPDEINLGNCRFNNYYKQAVVKIAGKKPGTYVEMEGQSITYGITMIKNAPNKKAAVLFLKYLLNPKGGLKVLKQAGQFPLIPARIPGKMKNILPEELQKIVSKKN